MRNFKLINWIKKIAYTDIYIPGKIAILANSGWKEFGVVELLPSNEVTEGFGKYKLLKYYGKYYNDLNKKGKVGSMHLSNVYYSFKDLLKKELKTIFPDTIKHQRNCEYIYKAMDDFPELRTNLNFSKLVEFDTININGFIVELYIDPRSDQRGWYWYLPESGTRSLYIDIDNQLIKSQILLPWGSGRFATKEEAAESANKFIDYTFYSGQQTDIDGTENTWENKT